MKALACYTKLWILFLVGLAPLQYSLAVEVPGLFREVVPVASQSRGDRQQAAREAMGTVLVRLSGTDAVLLSDDIRRALSSAENYLGQFSYQHNPEDEDFAYLLAMEFQPQPTIDLLQRSGQPYWPGNRPLILACVSLDEGLGVQHLSRAYQMPDEEGIDWLQVVQEQARRRGLPVELPKADDGLACATQASMVNADLALSGMLRMVGESCVAEWQLPFEGQEHQWKFGNESAEDCVAQAMDAVAELLSASYAFASLGGDEAPLLLDVNGIASFAQYTEVILMLEGLAMVSSVTVSTVDGDRVRFSLDLQGDVDKLRQAIRMKRLLVEEDVVQQPQAVETVPDNSADPLADPAAQVGQAQAAQVAPPAQTRLSYRLASNS